jgi:hypothetical protein
LNRVRPEKYEQQVKMSRNMGRVPRRHLSRNGTGELLRPWRKEGAGFCTRPSDYPGRIGI